MTTAPATVQLTPEASWHLVPARVRKGDATKPYMVAICRKGPDGKGILVEVAKSAKQTIDAVHRLEAITGQQHFRSLLKPCPYCHNYGYTTSENDICHCPAGDAFREEIRDILLADELVEQAIDQTLWQHAPC